MNGPFTTAEIERVLGDTQTPSWLRAALREALQRDPAEAISEAEALLRLLEDRLVAVAGESA